MSQEDKPFRKISEKEYELVINGRTKTISIPYIKVEKLFSAYVTNGGVIDENGQVVTDIVTLVTSFRAVGDIMLTEYEVVNNKIVVAEEGDCSSLSHSEVIALFQLSSEVISNFILSLSQISPQAQTQEVVDEKSKK